MLFEEKIYYARNDIQNPFKLDILKYAERLREMFEMPKLHIEDCHEDSCETSVWKSLVSDAPSQSYCVMGL